MGVRRSLSFVLVSSIAFVGYLTVDASAFTPTTVFAFSGAPTTYVVGATVNAIAVDAVGGGGGAGSSGGSGGKGGAVHAVLAVTPGETLQVNVGGGGTAGSVGAGGAGGFNGGAAGAVGSDGGGGGGGASDVRRAPNTVADRLVVASGAGGGGGFSGGNGGDGGEAGADGGSAQGGGGRSGGNGGSGGVANAATNGSDGSATSGGTGGAGIDAGGGGGGGLIGGGGGGGNGCCPAGGGGGGGGSSFGPADSRFESGVQVGNGQIKITALPDTAIDSHPARTTRRRAASFAFSTPNSGASFQCKLDAAAFAPCSSPKTYTGLSARTHRFSVRALDAFGNVDPTPATFAWRIRR